MSPVDAYYQVLDALTAAKGVDHILNTDPLAQSLRTLLLLANKAEHQEDEE